MDLVSAGKRVHVPTAIIEIEALTRSGDILCMSSDSRPSPCRCIVEQGIGQTSGQRLIVSCRSFMVPSVHAPAR